MQENSDGPYPVLIMVFGVTHCLATFFFDLHWVMSSFVVCMILLCLGMVGAIIDIDEDSPMSFESWRQQEEDRWNEDRRARVFEETLQANVREYWDKKTRIRDGQLSRNVHESLGIDSN